MRDVHHRVTATIVLVVSVGIAGILFRILSKSYTSEVAAVFSFMIGIFLIMMYQVSMYRGLHHKISKINSLTQIWLGGLIVVGSAVTLILNLVLGVEFSSALIWMSGIILALLFVSIKPFDDYLARHLKA